MDGQTLPDGTQLPPLSPSLISFVASDASCLPHELDEAHWQRIGQVASGVTPGELLYYI